MPFLTPALFMTRAQTLATALRFNGTNQRLQRTIGTGVGFNTVNRLDVSFSFWFRVSALGQFNPIFTCDNGTGGSWIYIDTDDCLKWREADGSGLVYRTVNGTTPVEADRWYHGFVLLENAEAANQYAQIWLDGVRVSAGSQNQAATSFGLQTLTHSVGYHQNSNTFFEGDLAIFHWVDGAAMDSVDFADTIDGIYQAKEVMPVYDKNGSFLPFVDPDNLGADIGNGWTYTLSNITVADLIGDGPATSY